MGGQGATVLLSLTEDQFVNTAAFDRHRGGGRPPTPATPPCVRVRTRRFETFGLTSLEQRRKTAIAEIGIRERNMQSFRMGQMPRAVGTAGGVNGQPCPYTQLNQHFPSAA